MDFVARGTRVSYHGSMDEYHGTDFVVAGTTAPRHSPDKYPGAVAYTLKEVDGDAILMNVRRSSFQIA